MQVVELQEFFGPLVIVQFREAIALVTPGKKQTYFPMSPSGEMRFVAQAGEVRPVAHEQLVPEVDKHEFTDDGVVTVQTNFTMILQAKLMPAAGGRILVLYKAGDHIAKVAVRPEDIIAVTSIEENPGGGGRIVAPSS